MVSLKLLLPTSGIVLACVVSAVLGKSPSQRVGNDDEFSHRKNMLQQRSDDLGMNTGLLHDSSGNETVTNVSTIAPSVMAGDMTTQPIYRKPSTYTAMTTFTTMASGNANGPTAHFTAATPLPIHEFVTKSKAKQILTFATFPALPTFTIPGGKDGGRTAHFTAATPLPMPEFVTESKKIQILTFATFPAFPTFTIPGGKDGGRTAHFTAATPLPIPELVTESKTNQIFTFATFPAFPTFTIMAGGNDNGRVAYDTDVLPLPLPELLSGALTKKDVPIETISGHEKLINLPSMFNTFSNEAITDFGRHLYGKAAPLDTMTTTITNGDRLTSQEFLGQVIHMLQKRDSLLDIQPEKLKQIFKITPDDPLFQAWQELKKAFGRFAEGAAFVNEHGLELAHEYKKQLQEIFSKQAEIFRRMIGLKAILVSRDYSSEAERVRVRSALDNELEEFLFFDNQALKTLQLLFDSIGNQESTKDLQGVDPTETNEMLSYVEQLSRKTRLESLLENFV